MENIEILYDHYKESNQLSQNAQKQRSRYFCGICILEIINIVFLLYPSETIDLITKWLDKKYSIVFPPTVLIIQGILWLFIIYFTVLYFQKNIYIERQYKYLSELEIEISKKINLECFCREGKNYNENYPLVLTVIDRFYKWGIPITIIIINTIKIIFEYIKMSNLLITLFDTLCYIFVLVLTILYIKKINFET